ncbi:MAG TPA: YihY/virulence factor BrkB family protein [Bacteroidia bacterium]|jgi:membrane protein|nr:YihY/virulence factor BrkB family protein [Bacteroidia bacterium]
MKQGWAKLWFLLKNTTKEFISDNGLTLSASLSYYTIFSLPPLLIVIIAIFDFFFGPDAVRGELFGQIKGIVGNATAAEIQDMIKNVRLSNSTIFATVFGAAILLIGASGIFAEMQTSINYIWGIEAKPKRGLAKFLKNRLMSVSMIGSVGFLLLVGLIINALMDVLDSHLVNYFPGITVYLFYVLNILSVFLIITVLFTIIFKTLPDGTISMKDSIIGAIFTSLLFMLGKFLIGAYIVGSHIASVYGAMGSIILILVWVYYSSIILYFGAEFTKVYAHKHGQKIIPNEYSVQTQKGKNSGE